MKQKDKQLKYARQYQTISAKEWRKVVFSTKRNSVITVQMAFRSTGVQEIFQERIIQRYNGSLLIWRAFLSEGKLELQFVSGRQKAADFVKMLNDLSPTQERRRLCGEEWIFQRDSAAIHNASKTKKYLLEQKIRLLDHVACTLDLNPVENLKGINCCKSLWRRSTVLSNFWTQRRNLRHMGKYFRFNFRN